MTVLSFLRLARGKKLSFITEMCHFLDSLHVETHVLAQYIIKILPAVFSCCGGGLLHLLGTIPRAETRCFIRGRSGACHPLRPARLRRGHLHLRHPLLRQYHHQPYSLPHHVPQVSRGFQGEL